MIQLKFMSYILPRGYEKCNKNLKKLRPVKNSPEPFHIFIFFKVRNKILDQSLKNSWQPYLHTNVSVSNHDAVDAAVADLMKK